ncbi:hypothetical protein MTO96_006946 [Rhipicephalus appendiculatus]
MRPSQPQPVVTSSSSRGEAVVCLGRRFEKRPHLDRWTNAGLSRWPHQTSGSSPRLGRWRSVGPHLGPTAQAGFHVGSARRPTQVREEIFRQSGWNKFTLSLSYGARGCGARRPYLYQEPSKEMDPCCASSTLRFAPSFLGSALCSPPLPPYGGPC